jgi:GGDEF domain-containing protein
VSAGGTPHLSGLRVFSVMRLNFQPLTPVEASRTDDLPFLVLGGKPPRGLQGEFDGLIGDPCAAILLIGSVQPAELLEVLDAAPDPAVPVADFGAQTGVRHDFTAKILDDEAIADLRWTFTPLWQRLAEIPFRASLEDRADLIVLRLAYSRDTPIEANFAIQSHLLVSYPLLDPMPGVRHRLEHLADLDLLHRRHFTRTHACGKCGAARLHVYEACPTCDSAHIKEESLVHHYRCGWQEAESKFAADRILLCPKCHRELRHYGVDYGKPGTVTMCQACGAANAEPKPLFACLDCGAVTPTADAAETDWYHYDLSEEGLRALHLGRLPRFDFQSLLEGRTRAFSRREFQLLATEGMRVARRYHRPFTVARISLLDVNAVRGITGAADVDAAFRLAVDVIVETLRDSDFVTAHGPNTILLGFPETSAKDANVVVERLRRRISETIVVPIDLAATTADEEAAADLLIGD